MLSSNFNFACVIFSTITMFGIIEPVLHPTGEMAEQEVDIASIACGSSIQGNGGEDFQKHLGRFCTLCGT